MTTNLLNFLQYFETNKKLFWPTIKENHEKSPVLFEELGEKLCKWAGSLLGEHTSSVLANGYVSFVTDVNRSQIMYESQQSYKSKSYAEVYEAVYGNREFMEHYHWGVYATTFLWPHHLRLCEFYQNQFLPLIKNGPLLELGSGSGVWSLLALDALDGISVTGIDISETSVNLAKQLATAVGVHRRANYQLGDALNFRAEHRYKAGLSCFVLEHLEEPQDLLVNLAKNLDGGAYAFVTGALTAAEVDHIYEFRKESELVELSERSGFRVIAMNSFGPEGHPREFKFLPRSMAMILQKRQNEIW